MRTSSASWRPRPGGLLVNLLLLPLLGADWSAAAVPGELDPARIGRGLHAPLPDPRARSMSILSPLTAVISAVIPVGVASWRASGSDPGRRGLLIAVLAIVLVGGGPSAESSRPGAPRSSSPSARGPRSPPSSSVCTRLRRGAVSPPCSRGASSPRASCWCRRDYAPAHRDDTATLGARRWFGALSALANLPSCWPSVRRPLDRGVITALYPGATVVLAWVVLGERLHRVQVAGLAAAGLAVCLLALG